MFSHFCAHNERRLGSGVEERCSRWIHPLCSQPCAERQLLNTLIPERPLELEVEEEVGEEVGEEGEVDEEVGEEVGCARWLEPL